MALCLQSMRPVAPQPVAVRTADHAEQHLGGDARVDAAHLAHGDRLLDRPRDQQGQLLALAQPLARVAVALGLVAVDQGEEEAPVPEVGERAAHDQLDPPGGRVGRGERRLELDPQARDALEHDRQVQRALAREVAVERALADAARLRDLVHLHLVVLVAGEDGLGSAQDVVAQPGDRRAAAAAGGELGRDGDRHELLTRPSGTAGGDGVCQVGGRVRPVADALGCGVPLADVIVLLAVATAGLIAGRALGLPAIVAYLVAGVVAGMDDTVVFWDFSSVQIRRVNSAISGAIIGSPPVTTTCDAAKRSTSCAMDSIDRSSPSGCHDV